MALVKLKNFNRRIVWVGNRDYVITNDTWTEFPDDQIHLLNKDLYEIKGVDNTVKNKETVTSSDSIVKKTVKSTKKILTSKK